MTLSTCVFISLLPKLYLCFFFVSLLDQTRYSKHNFLPVNRCRHFSFQIPSIQDFLLTHEMVDEDFLHRLSRQQEPPNMHRAASALSVWGSIPPPPLPFEICLDKNLGTSTHFRRNSASFVHFCRNSVDYEETKQSIRRKASLSASLSLSPLHDHKRKSFSLSLSNVGTLLM